ncbi:hypothetical protein D3C80_423610 [compost metagenome]
MLREEHQVHADEHDPEMQLADRLVIHVAEHFREPVIPGGKDGEDRAERQDVVEMGHDVIGVVKRAVEAGIGQLHAGDAANGEQEDKADRPDHRCRKRDRAAPHGRDPGEDLDACRHRDHHRGENEITLRIERQANRVHVVGPDDEADSADRHHCIGHAEITEDRLFREGRDDVADDAEAGQDENVDFRVTEEPEQMLVEDRVAAAFRREECGAEVTVGQRHGDGTGQNRQ